MQRPWAREDVSKPGQMQVWKSLNQFVSRGHTTQATAIEEVYPRRSISPLRGPPETWWEVPTHVSDRSSHTELPLGCALTGADLSAGIHFRERSWGQSALRGFGDLRLTLFGGIRVFSDSRICVFWGI